MSIFSKVALTLFFASLILSATVMWMKYMSNEEFVFYTDEEELPDPFDINNYR